MVSKTVVIKNEQGLHMRPAGVLAKEAAKYKSNISLVFNGKKINAKSVMNIIAGCMKCGSQIEVECDEQEACESITALIESGLGE